jgi:hypothetical protein
MMCSQQACCNKGLTILLSIAPGVVLKAIPYAPTLSCKGLCVGHAPHEAASPDQGLLNGFMQLRL